MVFFGHGNFPPCPTASFNVSLRSIKADLISFTVKFKTPNFFTDVETIHRVDIRHERFEVKYACQKCEEMYSQAWKFVNITQLGSRRRKTNIIVNNRAPRTSVACMHSPVIREKL